MKKTDGYAQGFTIAEIAIVVLIVAILFTLAVPKFEVSRRVANLADAQQGLQVMATGIFAYRELSETGGKFPPAGEVMQSGWSAWSDFNMDSSGVNGPGNNFHACAVLWVDGSFYESRGDSGAGDGVPVSPGSSHYDLRVLTSPTEVLLDFPRDPFKNDGESIDAQYDYFGLNLDEEFVLRSLGPDGTADVGCEFRGFDCSCSSADCLQLETGIANRRVFDATRDSNFGCPDCSTLDEALKFGNIVYSPTNGVESLGDIFQVSSDGNPDVTSVKDWENY